jgi:nitroreductase
MDAWTAISTMRAIRSFADRPLEPADLERILRAGRHAGSSKNRQRWDFVVCRDREHLRELSAVGPYAGHLAGAALAIALVTPSPRRVDARLSVMFDLGLAAENMMLAAWELGMGSVPATVYDQDLVRRLLGFPAEYHCEFLISFGYPADKGLLTAPPRPGGRKPLESIVHEERW